jgi:hypothetical protein
MDKYFMGITAHYIDRNWQSQQIAIADKYMKNASHSGMYQLIQSMSTE